MYNEELRARAEEYTKENRITKKDLADRLDVNRTSLHQYLANPELVGQKTIDKIEDGLTGILFRANDIYTSTYKNQKMRNEIYETSDCLGVMAICKICQEDAEFGLVYGRAGYGKTYCLKHYARNKRVAYVECNEAMTARDVMKAIERALGLPKMPGSIDDRMDNIKDFFNANEGYLLIIDEADKLISRYAQRKAEIIRSLHDMSDVGVILAGEPALEKTIRSYIPRASSRIACAYELQGLSPQEVVQYICEMADWDEDASAEIVRRGTNKHNGCFRLLNRTCRNISRITNEGERITLDKVREASALMLL